MRRLNTAKPINQRGAWLHALSQRFASRAFSLAAAFLALLLFVAPTWHVCALSGNMTCHDHGASQTENSAESSQKPKVLICGFPDVEEENHAAVCKPSSHSADEICECTDDETSDVASLTSTHTTHFNENCLARLLWNFPAALIIAFVLFLPWSRRVTRYASTDTALLTTFVARFEARGPPIFFLI